MGMFADLKTDDVEESKDRLGGFSIFATNAYDTTIKLAYAGASASGAKFVSFVFDIGGQEYKETIYVTTREGNPFYMGKGDDSNKKFPLPGFTTVDDICLLASGFALADQDTEEKVVKIYDFDAKEERPTTVPVLMGLVGKNIKLGIQCAKVFKQKKGDDGKYHDTAETREENEIDKIFHAETGRTVNEYRHEVPTAEFLPAWLKKNEGKTRDKTRGKAGASGPGAAGSGRPGGAPGGAPGSAAKSLFA